MKKTRAAKEEMRVDREQEYVCYRILSFLITDSIFVVLDSSLLEGTQSGSLPSLVLLPLALNFLLPP